MCHKASGFFFFSTTFLSLKSHSEQMLSRSLQRRAHCVASEVQPACPRSKFRAKRLGRRDFSPLNCILMCQTLSLHCQEFQPEKVLIRIFQMEQSSHRWQCDKQHRHKNEEMFVKTPPSWTTSRIFSTIFTRGVHCIWFQTHWIP